MAYLRMKRLGHDRKREVAETKAIRHGGDYSFIVSRPSEVSLTDGTKIKLFKTDIGKKVTIFTNPNGEQTFNIESIDKSF